MKYIQQLDETDCGAACLAMIEEISEEEMMSINGGYGCDPGTLGTGFGPAGTAITGTCNSPKGPTGGSSQGPSSTVRKS